MLQSLMKSSVSAPETSLDPHEVEFAQKKEIREKITEKWLCPNHSLPDKPVACWHHKDEPGVCYPLTIGNISYWASCIVSYLNYSYSADDLHALMGFFTVL